MRCDTSEGLSLLDDHGRLWIRERLRQIVDEIVILSPELQRASEAIQARALEDWSLREEQKEKAAQKGREHWAKQGLVTRRQEARLLKDAGWAVARIARKQGVDVRTVYRDLAREKSEV